MKIWLPNGNKYQIKIEIDIAEKQYQVSRLENDRQSSLIKKQSYARKVSQLQESFINMKKPNIIISLNEYQEMKADYWFYLDRISDTEMFIDILDQTILKLNQDVQRLEIERERAKTIVIEFPGEQRKAFK